MKYKAIRGMEDILPQDVSRWQKIEAISRDIFSKYGYREIRTPILEETALFIKSVGEDTDIVKKEMFSFLDRGERNVTLRPEGTAPIVRAYLENNLYKTAPFQKLYYIGPMFRAERPQAGRLRQFSQIGLEVIGSTLPVLDVDVILILLRILDSCGIKGYTLKINNLGCREDKKKLSTILKETLSVKTTTVLLCEDCRRRIKTNPLRVLDCKNDNCKKVAHSSFKKISFLCADCENHFKEVLEFLDGLKKKYEIDPYLVRGLDYYTKTVFEVTHGALGAQNAIGAGGRYDNLISDMGGPELGACGFALGFERMIMALGKSEDACMVERNIDIFIASIGKPAHERGFLLLNELRASSLSCDIDYGDKSLRSQMRTADRLSAKFVLIIGEDEISKGKAVLRDMRTKEQIEIPFEGIVQSVKGRIS